MEPANTPKHVPGSTGFKRLNIAMLAAGIAGFGMLYSTQPLLPAISREFAIDPTLAALTVSASTGGLAVAVAAATWAAGRIGRIKTMRIGLLAAVIAQMVSTLMPDFALVVAFRLVLGLALAGLIGVAMGHVGQEVDPKGMGTAMGLFIAGNSIGGVLGRLVASGASDLGSWRLADATVGLVAGAAAVVFVVTLPPSVYGDHSQYRVGGRLALWLRPEIIAIIAVPFFLMGGFVAVYNYLTYRLELPPFALPASLAGLVFLTYLTGTVSSVVAGRAADRVGPPVVAAVSLVVAALGLLLTWPDRLITVVVGLAVFTMGFFAAHAVASGWVPLIASDIGPQASGAYITSYYAGSSILGASLGLAWTSGGWPAVVCAVLALLLAGGVCIGVVTLGRLRT